MTKYDFMKELEELLSDISSDERMEALQYYENYFEDAGPESEQNIIAELGSPERVAASIKADLNTSGQEAKSRGYFTEKGYEDESFNEPKYEIMDGKSAEEGSSGPKESGSGYTNSRNSQYSGNYKGNPANGSYNRQDEERYGKGNNDNGLKVIVIILLCIFAIPVGIPLVASAFVLFISAIITVAVLWLTFVIVSAALIIAGIAATVLGIIKLMTFPALGFCFAGGGLIVFGIGLLFTMATIGLSTKVMPVLIRGFINFCSLPFKNRRVAV